MKMSKLVVIIKRIKMAINNPTQHASGHDSYSDRIVAISKAPRADVLITKSAETNEIIIHDDLDSWATVKSCSGGMLDVVNT